MATVVALGDSVTVGVGDVGTPAGWAAHLAWSLGAQDFSNLARLGARARDVAREQAPVAMGMRPHLATLLVGGNDVLRGDFRASEVADHVEGTVDLLVGKGCDVVVVLLHDPHLTLPAPRIVREVLSERATAVNLAVRARIASAPRLVVVDPRTHPMTATREAWSIDRLHPSAAGHRALADMALASLAPLGWYPQRPLQPPCGPQTSGWRRAAWLALYGTPWFAKRSRDLLPDLVRACWEHHRQRRLRECASP